MKKYSSKIDFWLVALLGLVTLALAWSAWQSSDWGGAALLIAWLGGLAITMVPCYYVLDDAHLMIRAGVWKWHIPYADIQSVQLSNSILAGPALSLQRVEIRSGQAGSILVSPVDRDEFIVALKARMSARL
jgi:uncharacterized membrane protein YdbT with pleckstrin-like domain